MINEQYVSSEIYKLLREKEFDGEIHTTFDKEGYTQASITLQSAMQWLREEYHIHVCPEYKAFFQERPRKIYHHWCNKIVGIDRYFRQGINDWDTLNPDYFYFHDCKTYHDSYEGACMECIKYALENLLEEEGEE